jgi:hydroxymethylbilane synthase
MRPLVVGTRGSALALWQTEHVAAILRAAAERSEALTISVTTITTRGDTDQSPVLAGKLGKGFFTQELEAALRAREIDFAVHSLKDLPTQPAADLTIGAILPRGPSHDLLIVRREAVEQNTTDQLPLLKGAKVGSSSLRRTALLARYAPGAQSAPLRGNVPTRIARLVQGKYDGIVLAAAGVERLALDLSACVVFDLNPRVWVPAPGQGAIAVQCRDGHSDADGELETLLGAITHKGTADDTALERLYLQALEGGCTTPFGCVAQGHELCLGLDIHGGWRRAIAPRSASITSILQKMQAADYYEIPGETSGKDWLYRGHRPSEVQGA